MPVVSRRDVLFSGLAFSASAALVPRAWARAQSALDAIADQTSSALAPREKLLFDFGWKFQLGDGHTPAKDLDFGNDQGSFAKTGDFKFSTKHFDDTKWRTLDLPHDWAVELPFVWDDDQMSHGYKPIGRRYPETSVGWYRRAFEVPASDEGRRIRIEFDGAFRSALVFVNGCFIGRNDNGYAPFGFDITDFLHFGQKNYIVVRMDASFGDGWFYEGAGLYRHVWLVKHDPLHLGQWESYIRTEVAGKTATLSLGTVVENIGDKAESARVRWEIKDAAGKTVATAESTPQSVEVDGKTTFTASAKIANPELWSPETPTLYSAIVTVEANGKARDAERVPFGVRTIKFDVDKGFFLNGQSVKIKGTCNHQDHAGVGAALPDRLQYFRIGVLKEMGSNGVRTSHNMPTPEWVEACDRMGMLMMCETRQMSSNPEALEQLSIMIKRYRNSPSVIVWSMGNEEWYLQKDVSGEHVIATMVRRSHELDPTRQCTAAVNGSYGTGISKGLDIEGFNYNLKSPDDYHKKHPTQPCLGSETASALSTRGEYFTDKIRNVMSAYDTNKPGWGETAEEWWKFYGTREWLAGGFAWTGFDYRGEPTPYGWPSISSQFGIVDTCGYPKDTYFYYKAWWGKDPVLHLFPHWNFEGKEGVEIPVWVHSNLDSVELFVNGQSQGSKPIEHLGHAEWKVKYAPGTIEARGTKDGKVVLTEKRETVGKPVTLKLSAERTTIDADGEDIAILRAEVLDEQGRHVPTANFQLKFKVTGAGKLIGVGNGDPNCHESDNGPERSLYNGLAQIIVQATKTPGQIAIEASSNDDQIKPAGATLTITTQQATLRPAVPETSEDYEPEKDN
ncbi:beta-galactosidase GalA [Silvibacterium sp.]|uniref:beta-galactosidase GalA n=1 Tax=Silvibacterium sp. TaxID=1964179 RepID=UPI0039E2F824